MTSAYSVFANDGIKNKYTPILKIEDKDGNVLEDFSANPDEVLPANTARQISSILNDDKARQPAYGPNSMLYFPGRDVAVKTGTTNDYKDAWIIGYTPSLTVGAWAGNNKNTPMEKKVAGQIIAPLWNAFMKEALQTIPDEKFTPPQEIDPGLKPVLRGFWQGNTNYFIDKISGLLATDYTPAETKEEKVLTEVHSILYWVDKKNPLGPKPENPNNDYQFSLWEYPIQKWLLSNPVSPTIIPTTPETIHTEQTKPKVIFLDPKIENTYNKTDKVYVRLNITSFYPINKIEYYLNGTYVGSSTQSPFNFSFLPNESKNLELSNELKVVVYDAVWNRTENTIDLKIYP
jgi:penicillin-binding protein 1A